MIATLPGTVQTAYRDLLEQCQAAAFEDAFPDAGTFVKKTVKGRTYWYFRAGGKERYVGPETPELLKRIETHRKQRLDERQRRTTIAMLRSAGLPAPTPQVGQILQTLARAGVFRKRACVVGTQAFGCYVGILGARLTGTALATQDLDLAQFQSISVAIAEDDKLDSLVDVLHKADPTFRPVSKALGEGKPIAYVNSRKYKVEVLTPNRGPDRDDAMPLPAIGSYAHPFRFLDFLIYDAVPAVILHGAGVVVNVPAPERYAVHKLIVSHRRQRDSAKVIKDRVQAAELISAMWEYQRVEVVRAFEEAARRGEAWREALSHAMPNNRSIPGEALAAFEKILASASAERAAAAPPEPA
jgi:hypothetical protein